MPCTFRYVSNFTTASCGFSATARISCWSLSAHCSELSVKKWQVLERTSQIAYSLQPIIYVCLRWNFYGGLRKFCLFLQEWRIGPSRSSKVIDFGANRKRVCDFLLVRNSNLGPILHRFGDFAAFTCMCSWPHLYSTQILGVFALHQIAHFGVSKRISLKLLGGEIIFEVCDHGT